MSAFRLSVERDEICKECGGIGGAAGAVKQCDNCQGCGIQVTSSPPLFNKRLRFQNITSSSIQAKVRQLGPGMLQQIQASCDKVINLTILPCRGVYSSLFQ